MEQSKTQRSSSLLALMSSPPNTSSRLSGRANMPAKSRLQGCWSPRGGGVPLPQTSSHSQLSCSKGRGFGEQRSRSRDHFKEQMFGLRMLTNIFLRSNHADPIQSQDYDVHSIAFRHHEVSLPMVPCRSNIIEAIQARSHRNWRTKSKSMSTDAGKRGRGRGGGEVGNCVEPPQVVVLVHALSLLLEGVTPEDIQVAALRRRAVKHPGWGARVGGAGVEPGLTVDLQHRQVPQRLLVGVEPAWRVQDVRDRGGGEGGVSGELKRDMWCNGGRHPKPFAYALVLSSASSVLIFK